MWHLNFRFRNPSIYNKFQGVYKKDITRIWQLDEQMVQVWGVETQTMFLKYEIEGFLFLNVIPLKASDFETHHIGEY